MQKDFSIYNNLVFPSHALTNLVLDPQNLLEVSFLPIPCFKWIQDTEFAVSTIKAI